MLTIDPIRLECGQNHGLSKGQQVRTPVKIKPMCGLIKRMYVPSVVWTRTFDLLTLSGRGFLAIQVVDFYDGLAEDQILAINGEIQGTIKEERWLYYYCYYPGIGFSFLSTCQK